MHVGTQSAVGDDLADIVGERLPYMFLAVLLLSFVLRDRVRPVDGQRVFLLSRLKEEYHRTGDNATAVAHGLAKTARLIPAAAAVMICVFASFLLLTYAS